MSPQTTALTRLAERDGITVYEHVPTGPDLWQVKLTFPLSDPWHAEMARMGATQTSPSWPYVNDAGVDKPRVGHVLLQWLQLGFGCHPLHAVPAYIEEAMRADVEMILGDKRNEYFRAAGVI
ncbi:MULTISPECIES: hypothetical protein [Streptomyces]|uniref:hypothetical protein n=1 Tax=Streptomyces TaxID=1883 RepID=UPI0009403146|nr:MULTISPECIES: hypothetical protein [unclassified Streptomyces]OKJ07225.1 hypothetical protein AMK20_27975 [Streptomyces sp. TSRI0261]QNQ37774.1 hypothetical protein HYC88_31465 [Streptomyces sp. CB00271]